MQAVVVLAVLNTRLSIRRLIFTFSPLSASGTVLSSLILVSLL